MSRCCSSVSTLPTSVLHLSFRYPDRSQRERLLRKDLWFKFSASLRWTIHGNSCCYIDIKYPVGLSQEVETRQVTANPLQAVIPSVDDDSDDKRRGEDPMASKIEILAMGSCGAGEFTVVDSDQRNPSNI
jgi:hypothetical protein